MKHNFLKKLIAASVITSSVFSICPTTVFAASYGQWSKQGGNWYYYVGGQLKTGWIYDKAGWYYADKNGVMQTGVIQVGGKIYLLADSGVMQTGTVVINGKVYTAGEDGAFYGDDLPVPTKSFDWYGTNDNIVHPSQVIDSYEDDSSSEDAVIAYDPLAPKEKFQVIFKDEDGDDLKIRNVEDGSTITLYKPTKKGYEFVEWNTKKNGNGKDYDYDEEIKVEKDIKLYAIWDEVEVTDENAEELGVVRVEDITIVPEGKKKEITTDKGTLKFSVDVLPVNADNKKVSWSVESETGKATISDKGLLTAEENGVVIVKATAKDGSGAADSMRITISGQKSSAGTGEGGTGSGSGSGTGTGSSDEKLPVIKGEDIIINNTATEATTESMKGKTYGTVRIATNGKDPVLQNIKANKIVINGGDDIVLDNCQVNYIEVLRPGNNSTVTLRNGSTVQIVNIERGITLAGTGYNKVNIKTDEVVTINTGVVINTVNVIEENAKVEVNGKVNTMHIESSAVDSMVQGTGSIDKLINDAVNVDISVSNIGSILGTVGGENSSQNTIGEAKKLQQITKLVEKIEKANLRYVNTLSEVDSDMKDIIIGSVKITKDLTVAKLKEKLDSIADNNIYKAEYEQLSLRLSQLEKSNTEATNIKDAANYVSALQEAVTIDPTSSIKFDVKYTTGEAVKLELSGGSETAEKLCNNAQALVDKLSIGLNQKASLQDKINSEKEKIEKGKNLKTLIETINKSTTDSGIGLTVSHYSNAGITGVKDSNLELVNKYVCQLSSNKDFEVIPSKLATREDKSIDKYSIANIITKDKQLIDSQIASAKQTLTNINNTNNSIAKVESKIDELYYVGGSLVERNINIDNLEEIKRLFDQASEDKKQLDSKKEYVDDYISIKARYDELETKIAQYALIVTRKEVNSLYYKEAIDSNGTKNDPLPDIVSDLTLDKIKEVSSLIKKFEQYPGYIKEKYEVYGMAINDVAEKYEDFQKVLEGLDGQITIAGKEVKRNGTIYSDSVKFSSDSSQYAVTAAGSNYNVVTQNNKAPMFSVLSGTSDAVIQVKASSENYSLTVGTISEHQESSENNKKYIISFSATGSVNEYFTISSEKYNYKFQITVKPQISNNDYICTINVKRVYQ